MNKALLIKTFRNTLLATAYIFGVSQLMQNGGKLFGEGDNIFTPFIILLLFSLSAAVVGGLVLGQSLALFLEDKKKESLQAAFYSISWMALYTVLVLIGLVIAK